ncbi:sugar ABC transporter ATP-binding protein [Sediminivirga luteola]|uniref:ABC transporter ATP-binding protein n=1 Tax=Sediminivirga luteola TaxID=1774748 RepID=A0A8J2TVY9_9MICO|nr:sugar ABC transporter ATP-binding protein [Sediminivirga luteola]GGA06057.1 ABC transporter ATP-binding protein [Sediminivirga luteola]
MTEHIQRAPGVVVAVSGLTKHYPGVQALTDADMSIRAGEVRALLGRNGAGKSTLIRLLSGVETPDAGTIVVDGQPLDGGVRRAGELGVQPVHQELSLVPQLSVAENLFLGSWPLQGGRIDYGRMRDETSRVLGELELRISPDATVGELPLAEQQLVEIARAVRRQPRLLILDEPTSALAASEVKTVLETVRRIAESGVAVIYVSHRLDEIRQVASSATVMRDGRIVETVGLEDVTTEQVVDLMLGETAQSVERLVTGEVDRDVTPLLRVRGLHVPPKLQDVSFDVFPGEVLGIAGLMGAGRSELLRALAGFESIAAGTVTVAGERLAAVRPRAMKRLGVGLTPEDRKGEAIIPLLGVDENLTLADYRSVSTGPTIGWRRLRETARTLIQRLGIAAAGPQTPIVNLSGGNQQKAVIGRWLHAGSRILLLDEPTRGVDVQAKEEIYGLVRELADRGAAIVFVSGELEELPLVCDRVLILRDGGLAGEMTGDEITTDSVIAAAMATT